MAHPPRILILVTIVMWAIAFIQIAIAVVNPSMRGLPSRYVRAFRAMLAANMVVLAAGATLNKLNMYGNLSDSLFLPGIIALGVLWLASWTGVTIAIGVQSPELAARLHITRFYAWLHNDGSHSQQTASDTSHRVASGDHT